MDSLPPEGEATKDCTLLFFPGFIFPFRIPRVHLGSLVLGVFQVHFRRSDSIYFSLYIRRHLQGRPVLPANAHERGRKTDAWGPIYFLKIPSVFVPRRVARQQRRAARRRVFFFFFFLAAFCFVFFPPMFSGFVKKCLGF